MYVYHFNMLKLDDISHNLLVTTIYLFFLFNTVTNYSAKHIKQKKKGVKKKNQEK